MLPYLSGELYAPQKATLGLAHDEILKNHSNAQADGCIILIVHQLVPGCEMPVAAVPQ